MIITLQFYRISIPQPQRIPPPPELSPLEIVFQSLLVSVLQRSSFFLKCLKFLKFYVDSEIREKRCVKIK